MRIRGPLTVGGGHDFVAQAAPPYTRRHGKSTIPCQLTHQRYSKVQFWRVLTLSCPTDCYSQSVKTRARSQGKILKQQLRQHL